MFDFHFLIAQLMKQLDHFSEIFPLADNQIDSTFEVRWFCNEAWINWKLQSTATFIDESTFSCSFKSFLLMLCRAVVVMKVDYFGLKVK